MGCETLVTTGLAVVAGEITTTATLDYSTRSCARRFATSDTIAREVWLRLRTCAVMNTVKSQSPDIAMGVDTGGAGDQGLMFGFACDETEELMPMPIQLAHQLAQQLSEVRKSKKVPHFCGRMGSRQVSIEYRDGRPVRIDTVVISTQHGERFRPKICTTGFWSM